MLRVTPQPLAYRKLIADAPQQVEVRRGMPMSQAPLLAGARARTRGAGGRCGRSDHGARARSGLAGKADVPRCRRR